MASRITKIEQSLEILVPTAWSPDMKGKFFEELASEILARQSYQVVERVSFTGMEIDILARHKPSSEKVYVECKFLASPVGANVIDLMLGQGFRRKIRQLALFSAGPLSKGAQGAVLELEGDDRVSFAFYGPEMLLETMVDSGRAPRLDEASLPANISHATLLVYPDYPYIWLLQEQLDGRPNRIIPYCNAKSRPLPVAIRALLDKHEVLEGLPVVDYADGDGPELNRQLIPTMFAVKEHAEVVAQVITADTILDPRPCRPEDFIGRLEDQKQIWNYLSNVREGKSNTRLLALVGASGNGKSSLVSKLSERFRNKKWKNKYFLYPVDVRSARGALFVAEAVLQAIRNAGHAGFLEVPENLAVTDAASILTSPSIEKILSELALEKKVLVVFFDQFEEVFTKDELMPVFRAFRRFALDINSLQSNIVIGFSWRTGISFTDDNPAYQLWNELRDHRITNSIGKFESSESSGLITQYENALGVRLLPPLRRRLLEQGQGLPWFLKKLCIHVYHQIKGGVSQSDLLSSRLNVEALFNEDLDPLSESQLSCLRFIAQNSPVDSLEVYERYTSDVVASLSDRRLVIRAGQRFAVYWDIFRDFLVEEKVPAIPWSYIPNGTLNMSLSACEAIAVRGSITLPALAKKLNYSEATTLNIITDLQNCALVSRDGAGTYILLDGFSKNAIPERLRSQFFGHILYQQLLQNADEAGVLPRERAVEIVRNLYSAADVKPQTRDNYLTRMLPWLEFSGLVESDVATIVVFSGSRKSKRYGVAHGGNKGTIFLASAPPELAEKLLHMLVEKGPLSRESINASGLRNSAQDLSFLGLARWTAAGFAAIIPANTDAVEAFRQAVASTPVFDVLLPVLRDNPGSSRSEIGKLLATALKRDWKPSSAMRFANGLCRYIEHLKLSKTETT